jgi:hypothetical protein
MYNEAILDMDKSYIYVAFDRDEFLEILAWLNEYAGQGSYTMGGSGVYFTNKEDASAFALKWT